jgi:hypothetical protein
LNEGGRILFVFISKVGVSRQAILMKMNGIYLVLNRAWVCPRQLRLILKAIFWRNKIQNSRTQEEALHHPSHWPENSKEPNPRPSTTPPLPTGQKNSKNRTHDQALHHPSPLARKLKRIPLPKNHLKYGALNSIDDITHVHARAR